MRDSDHTGQYLAAILCGTLALAAWAGDGGYTVRREIPSAFHADMEPRQGWYWLQRDQEKVSWEFTLLRDHDDRSVDFCLEARSSNTINGGSGHGAYLHVEIRNSETRQNYITTLTLTNRVDIITDSDSRGVGHASDGCVRIRSAGMGLQSAPFTVTITYPEGNPSAVRGDSAYIVYTVPRR